MTTVGETRDLKRVPATACAHATRSSFEPPAARATGSAVTPSPMDAFDVERDATNDGASTPESGTSVQSLHWCAPGVPKAYARSPGCSSQHSPVSPHAASIATLPSPQKQSTMPSTPFSVIARKRTGAKQYAVIAFTDEIIAYAGMGCQDGPAMCEFCCQVRVPGLIPTAKRQ